jgi:hypothetical protein
MPSARLRSAQQGRSPLVFPEASVLSDERTSLLSFHVGAFLVAARAAAMQDGDAS